MRGGEETGNRILIPEGIQTGSHKVKNMAIGLQINISKIKVISNQELKSKIVVKCEKIESVNEFIYLGKCVEMPK